MVALGETVTVVNKSGKVVKSSKHLVNVFKEAKSAYGERKAELKAQRREEAESKVRENKARQRFEELKLEDESDTSSRRSSRRGSEDSRSTVQQGRRGSDDSRSTTRERRRGGGDGKPSITRPRNPPMERGYSDSFYANDRPQPRRSPTTTSKRPSPLRFDTDGALASAASETRGQELIRRNTDGLISPTSRARSSTHTHTRSASLSDIDPDLAYGELPPPLPERTYDTEIELRAKMTTLQQLLDECNCLQHSVTATIDNLQKNPDALAAVALTLGEISTLAAKMAPGALASLKTAFPAVIALLASPQFAIAAGVGVGVTVIAFGGYKIVKRIKANKAEKAELLAADALEYGGAGNDSPGASDVDELREINRIENWRRGIAEVEAESMGTSVDGEFVTPAATRTLIEEGRLKEGDLKKREGRSEKRKEKKAKELKERGDRASGKKGERKAEEKRVKDERKRVEKENAKVKGEPVGGGLRMLFKKSAA